MTELLRVASYNIRKAIGQDARRDPERILQVVSEFDVDLVALQEADHRFKRRQAIFEPGAIKKATGLSPVPLGHGENGLGWHGNIILAHPRLMLVDARPVRLSGLEPRGAVRADFTVEGRRLRVVAAHLGLLGIHRRRQAAALLATANAEADAEEGQATIVMGDFNGWGRARYSLEPLGKALLEARCGPSFPSNRPLTRLDRIYYGGSLELVSSSVVRSAQTRVASDHLPVRATFALGAAAAARKGAGEGAPPAADQRAGNPEAGSRVYEG